jgi:hypothetical protein
MRVYGNGWPAVANPWLTAGDLAEITTVNLDGLATKQAVYPARTVDLVLERDDPDTGESVVLPPQRVLLDAISSGAIVSDESGASLREQGWFEREVPFDVRPGDAFSLPTLGAATAGQIIAVEIEELGTQRASWGISLGDPSS